MTAFLTWAGTTCRMRKGDLLTIRHCSGMAELEACVDLQRQTWGYPDLEVTPRKAFMLAQELGGQVIAAFNEQGTMAGFAMAMAAFTTPSGKPTAPELYLHSHMLAVQPAYRDQGLGTRLKLAQREDALARGIPRMTWTFDPLAAKNAYLNLHRLGAIARRYSRDFYGVSSSRLQAGLPTDRLHAEWWLQSERVVRCVRAFSDGGPVPARKSPAAFAELSEDGARAHPTSTICLPHEVEEWKQNGRDLEKVRQLQTRNGTLFLEAFAQGLAVTGFSRDADSNGVFELAEWRG